MCHFITLIVPTDDAASVSAVMGKYGRAAKPVDNPSIRRILRDGEHQYLTTRADCDCGTVLSARRDTAQTSGKKLADQEVRLQRRGWSNAKIARALEDRQKADAKATGCDLDSLELWEAALAAVREDLKLPYAGLFIGFYSGAIESEAFLASRRDVSGPEALRDALSNMKENEVTIFR